jgi:hypothetical protein
MFSFLFIAHWNSHKKIIKKRKHFCVGGGGGLDNLLPFTQHQTTQQTAQQLK